MTLEESKPSSKRYRQAVLKYAVEGKLTAEWRAKNKGEIEPADELLKRILAERRAKWEEQELAMMKAKGKIPEDNKWKKKYKEPAAPDTNGLHELPEGWVWTSIEAVANLIVDCPHSTPKWTNEGMICVRTTEFHPGVLDLTHARFVSRETYLTRNKRAVPESGDILFSREGAILGIACIVPPQAQLCMGQRMMLIRTTGGVRNQWVMNFLNSPLIQNRVRHLVTRQCIPAR